MDNCLLSTSMTGALHYNSISNCIYTGSTIEKPGLCKDEPACIDT